MKTLKLILVSITLLLTLTTIGATNNPDWGATGHRTIGKIAEDYLNSKSKRIIEDLLNGQSLALVATYEVASTAKPYHWSRKEIIMSSRCNAICSCH